MASAVVSESKTQPETKSQKGAATRDQILDAAARLIHVQGYHCTSLDDVLRESGVGKGNFYYYFKSKEDLGYAIIDRISARLRRADPRAGLRGSRTPIRSARSTPSSIACSTAQRQRNCVGGCAMGNLASELSDVHEGFRQRLADIFDVWPGPSRGGAPAGPAARAAPRRLRTPRGVAQFLVAGLEGAILLSKVTRDITVMERCVEELKRHLTLYRT